MSKLAVITGASSGLGKEFARQLAALGYDLWLVARRESLLNELKTSLERKFNVHVECLPADLAKPEDVRRLEERIQATDNLEFMVNNAGFGRDGAFPETDPDLEEEMIQVHVVALMRLSRAALIPMCRRKKGFLVNVASTASFLYGAGCAEYTATKAYVLTFSKSIQCDVKGDNVRVQALCPGLTHTGFHDTEGMKRFQKDDVPSFLWLSAEYVVRTSLRSIRGYRHRTVCIPSLRYKLILAVLCNPIGSRICEAMYDRRSRAAKAKRKAEAETR